MTTRRKPLYPRVPAPGNTPEERRALAHYKAGGWYRTGLASGFVKCPVCRVACHASWEGFRDAWEQRNLMVAALAEHLREEHPRGGKR